jgi:hypothetical protein
MFIEVVVQRNIVPVPVKSLTIDGKADAGKVFADDDPERSGSLIIDKVDVLIVAAIAYGDNAEDIAKIDLMPGKEINIEGQIEVFTKTQRVIRG